LCSSENPAQCAIPVFEGLLPEPDNGIVMDLLFDLEEWHSFAKLRVHTDPTLIGFDAETIALGQQIRKFSSITCMKYVTKELPRESAAQGRRKAAQAEKAAKLNPTAAASAKPGATVTTTRKERKRKDLNLSTYKLHALGDYARTIRLYGTTDSYNTQVVRMLPSALY
jgi:hypothetical protein